MPGKESKALDKRGFTLVELLVVIAIVGVVMAGVYQVYYAQQKSYLVQEQVAAMQQNLRAAMFYMERDIRMAGCDPNKGSGAAMTTANTGSISFTMDINDDSNTGNPDGDVDDTNENISYALSGTNLTRSGGGNIIAENIDAIDFVYLDGADPPVVLNPGGTDVPSLSIPNIRSVEITLVARTGDADRGYTDTDAYQNQQGRVILPAQNDNFHRRRLTTYIHCRNLGL